MDLTQLTPRLHTETHQKPCPDTLLVIASDIPPGSGPTQNRTTRLLKYLKQTWKMQVLTSTVNGSLENIPVHYARSWHPRKLMNWLKKFKLEKISETLIYPDDRIFWLIPALIKGFALTKQHRFDCIIVFMMPYSAGLVGVLLKWFTRLPLVLNFDDSPTCVDMHPFFPSWLHYQFTCWLEEFYIRQADAVIYVSQVTIDNVKARLPLEQHKKFQLIRYGADPQDFATASSPVLTARPDFEIVYIGSMTGWYAFYNPPSSRLRRWYRRWMQLGQYEQALLDQSSSSPIFIGQAVQRILEQNPDWQGRIRINVYGSGILEHVVTQVLQEHNLSEIVSVAGQISNYDAIQIAKRADLLFMALPDRRKGKVGGRISAKTYEYLMSDRPVLAALPAGENRNYLQGKPGVWLVEPKDVAGMADAIAPLAERKFSGQDIRYDRTSLHAQLSYVTLADDCSLVIKAASGFD